MIFSVLGIVFAAITVILAAKRSRTGTVIFASLTLILVLARTFAPSPNSIEALSTSHRNLQEICGSYLGQDLAQRHAGARVIILTPPEEFDDPEEGETERQLSPGQLALIEGLESAMQGKMASITRVERSTRSELPSADNGYLFLFSLV